jgi:hypothetical protein
MLDHNTSQTSVVQALRERLGALDAERSVLAARVHDLEAELQAAREAAQRCASEAIHLEALIAFYENHSQAQAPAIDSFGPASVEPEPPADRPQRADAEIVALPVRRATAQWTVAWRDEAIAVLRARGAPMHYRELYRAISARGFTFGGKSPEATFLASLSREQTTFVGVGRGCYWIAGESMTPDAVVAGPKRRMRRPKPIGGGR